MVARLFAATGAAAGAVGASASDSSISAASPVSATAAGSAAVRRWQQSAGGTGDVSVARFTAEFDVEAVIGQGEFGIVYRCRNRLDGCRYAVKKSKKRVAVNTYVLRQGTAPSAPSSATLT